MWIPFLGLGVLVAEPVRRAISPATMRPLVLGFCTVASLVVITRGLIAERRRLDAWSSLGSRLIPRSWAGCQPCAD